LLVKRKGWWITITISMVFPKDSIEIGGLLEDQTLKEGSTYNLLAMNIIPPTDNSGVTVRKNKSTKSEVNEEIVIEPWAVNIRNDIGNLISVISLPYFVSSYCDYL
jgi:hypothetical protein